MQYFCLHQGYTTCWLSSWNFFKGGKIYCYANFFCYVIVYGPNFREGQRFSGGQTASGGRPPPVEESQYAFKNTSNTAVPVLMYKTGTESSSRIMTTLTQQKYHSQLSLNGHLHKADTSMRRALWDRTFLVGFTVLQLSIRRHLSKRDSF